jgi:hypothetical protein
MSLPLGKGSSQAPSAPDPYQVAGAQGALNDRSARLSAQLNRTNINSPYGSQTWTQNGDQWTSNMSLNPQTQQLFDQHQGLALGLGNQAQANLSQPFSLGGAMDTLSSVLEPQYQRDEDALRTRLTNSGFRQGSEGFDQSLQDFQVNKDKSRAATAQQAFNLASALRTQPLTEMNMLQGSQPTMPQMQPGGNVGVNPADIQSAFGNQYAGQLANFNAQQQQQAGLMSGLFGLGGAALISDRRLKKNIKRIGTFLGFPWYRFSYIWGGEAEGVMADEVRKVKPQAVLPIGPYFGVNYGALNG